MGLKPKQIENRIYNAKNKLKRMMEEKDNLYVNAYNDTYFLVNQSGIQTFTGSLFVLTNKCRMEQVMALEDAIDILERELSIIEVTKYAIFIQLLFEYTKIRIDCILLTYNL